MKCILRTDFSLYYIFILFWVFIFNTTPQAFAGGHFEVLHETTLLDHGPLHLNIHPASNNGGYTVTGALGGGQAGWAASLDRDGHELWSYLDHTDTSKKSLDESNLWQSSQYKSAVVLNNGNALLCGSRDIGTEKHPIMMGLITQIDTKGKFIDQRLIRPHDDNSFKLNYLSQCSSWGDGYFVAGITTQNRPNLSAEFPPFLQDKFFWFVALDADGKVKWEKLIPGFYPDISDKLPWQVMSNGDLVFSGFAPRIITDKGSIEVTGIIRIGLDGEIKAQRNIPGRMKLVRQPNPAQLIRLVPANLKAEGMFMLTLHDDLSDASQLKGNKEEFVANQVVEMSDHSIVLAGYRDFRNAYATLIHYSPDLQQSQDYIFQPKGASSWVDDAIYTDKPNELATIRRLTPSSGSKNIFTILKLN